MAQPRASMSGGGYKQEPVYKQEPGVPVAANDHHQSHHPHPHPGATQYPPQHRPSSVSQQHQPSNSYQPSHIPQYATNGSSGVGHHAQEVPYYTNPSPYSTAPSAPGPYTSAAATETTDSMALAGMARPVYPPINHYHTPQSNSPASIASPSGHDQHGRNIYGQPPSQMHQPGGMYYPPPPQQQYPPMPQGNPSPYGQQPPPHHQSMGSQSNLLMSHQQAQHQMQHPTQQMTSSPRGAKQENIPPQLQQRSGPIPQGQAPPHHNQQIMNAPQTNGAGQQIAGGAGVSPNTNPGPIPATTPLVVRQDNNGVQWIAFEYSRDRVKMEYTIRCDVESVDVNALTAEFKNENCVYPRACCAKDQYRGNRFAYETDCNTVGWGLAELNPALRGKRGLIQRAVDSWRNSNQDPKYRSRRVRRMAKMNTRKMNNMNNVHAMLPQQNSLPGLPPTMQDLQRSVPAPNRPGSTMAQQQQLHHHHAHPDGPGGPGAPGAGGPDDGTGPDPVTLSPQHQPSYPLAQQSQYPTQQSSPYPSSSRNPSQSSGLAYNAYPSYPLPATTSSARHSSLPQNTYPQHASSASTTDPNLKFDPSLRAQGDPSRPPLQPLTNEGHTSSEAQRATLDPALFPPVKHPKYLHVSDERKGGAKQKVRVDLLGRDETEFDEREGSSGGASLRSARGKDGLDSIPDSERFKRSVWPRSWWGMTSKGSVTEAMVFKDDIEDSDDRNTESNPREEARGRGRGRGRFTEVKKVLVMRGVSVGSLGRGVENSDGVQVEVPPMTHRERKVEKGVNELGWRMAWVGQRTVSGRKVFLQRTLDMYRAKIAKGIEDEGLSVADYPVFDLRRERREFQARWGSRAETD